jgi:hypothetical protein
MATLVAAAFTPETNNAVVWSCSQCHAAFSLEYITSTPSVSELHKIDSDFRLHCKRIHPGEPVVGLTIKNPKEDSSQAAVRVVREATEGSRASLA